MDRNSSLIKVDRLGRMRFNREQKAALITAFESSGQSGQRFAAQHGVVYSTFANWLQQHRKNSRALALPALTFAEVECSPPSPSPPPAIEIRLSGGASVVVGDQAQLGLAVELLRQLARPC
jgi:transposase-like protein